MFLLIQASCRPSVALDSNLHSTMFLLILIAEAVLIVLIIFTFHNVSINSHIRYNYSVNEYNLHSTMFLLILGLLSFDKGNPVVFTFHNVSINSIQQFQQFRQQFHLHSTMFLLIHKSGGINGI